MSLSELRERIDRIDERITALFCERMGVSLEIAEYKRTHGIAVCDPERERMLLDRLEAASDAEMRRYTRALYERIIALSREYQHSIIDEEEK